MSCQSCARLGSAYINQPGTTALYIDQSGSAQLVGPPIPMMPGLGLVYPEATSNLGLVTQEIIGPLGRSALAAAEVGSPWYKKWYWWAAIVGGAGAVGTGIWWATK